MPGTPSIYKIIDAFSNAQYVFPDISVRIGISFIYGKLSVIAEFTIKHSCDPAKSTVRFSRLVRLPV